MCDVDFDDDFSLKSLCLDAVVEQLNNILTKEKLENIPYVLRSRICSAGLKKKVIVDENFSKFFDETSSELDLSDSLHLSDKCIDSLTSLKDLSKLILYRASSFSSISLCRLFSSCSDQLQHLNLSRCESIDSSCVKVIAKHCTKIEVLDLTRQNLTKSSLMELCTLRELRKLVLFNVSSVDDELLKMFAVRNPKLLHISLAKCRKVSDEGVIALTKNWLVVFSALHACIILFSFYLFLFFTNVFS